MPEPTKLPSVEIVPPGHRVVSEAEWTALRRCAALAYVLADSALDSGRPRQHAVDALAQQVCAMLDAGWDLQQMADDLAEEA